MIKNGVDAEFKSMFRLSRPVFMALVHDLSQWLKHGKSRNPKKNVPAEMKIGIALYYMAHGGDGVNLGTVSDLTSSTALKYLHRTAYLIVAHLGPKWMGKGLLQQPGYMERFRAGFQKRCGVPYVSLCVDSSHIPYKPNSGEDEQAFMNYKQWTSLLCVGYVNSLHLFVDMDVAYPGRMHDKTCTDYSHFWCT